MVSYLGASKIRIRRFVLVLLLLGAGNCYWLNIRNKNSIQNAVWKTLCKETASEICIVGLY